MSIVDGHLFRNAHRIAFVETSRYFPKTGQKAEFQIEIDHQKLFESLWPTSGPIPSRLSQLTSIISREEAASFLKNTGVYSGNRLAGKHFSFRKNLLSYFPSEASVCDGTCPDDRICFVTGFLTSAASDWYEAGGLARTAVEVLYELLGREWSSTRPCEDSGLGQCDYLCTEIYYTYFYVEDEYGNENLIWGWGYTHYCCGKEIATGGPGGGPGGSWEPGGLEPFEPEEFEFLNS